jgi:hypothetical protein
MINRLALVILSSVFLLNSGCYYQALYYPAGKAQFLWLPGIGEWKIDEQMPSGSLKESLDREYGETPRRELEAPEKAATAIVGESGERR